MLETLANNVACYLQSAGRDITKMFNEDLFKLDTSVVPAAIRYEVNPWTKR